MSNTARIALSPSTQTWNRYAGQATDEQERAYAQADACARVLRAHGIECRIMTAGKGDPANGFVRNANESNASGPWTAHVCLHTDAGGATGTTGFYHPASVAGQRLAQAIYDRLAPLSPGADHGVRARSDLYELNATASIAVLMEAAPHDRPADAAWLVANDDKIGRAYAEGILAWLGIRPQEDDMQLSDKLTRPDGTETTVGAILAYGDARLERVETFLQAMNVKMDEDRAAEAEREAWRAADVAWIIDTVRANPDATVEQIAAKLGGAQ